MGTSRQSHQVGKIDESPGPRNKFGGLGDHDVEDIEWMIEDFMGFDEVTIKPIERLVPVSFTGRPASTPGLSTWWSTTALSEALF